ncbi:E3 ubiquitin-protein ligase RNF4 [Halictus rubicundus]|uniref:E3 ubiquitin-protein ligase RNF4 n=1 Tax=Halictus rubicundus TaxID=77578 RepID=UPI0040363941
MSHPIDFIDLTIDSPANKTLRLQRFNSIQKSRHEDSPIYIPPDNSYKNTQSTEIIDLDNINVPENTTTHKKSNNEKRKGALFCPICYEELSSDRLPTSTLCGHVFCKICLTKAVRGTKQCPMCNKRVHLRRCLRIYF